MKNEFELMWELANKPAGDPGPDLSGKSREEIYDYLDGQFMRGKWNRAKLEEALRS